MILEFRSHGNRKCCNLYALLLYDAWWGLLILRDMRKVFYAMLNMLIMVSCAVAKDWFIFLYYLLTVWKDFFQVIDINDINRFELSHYLAFSLDSAHTHSLIFGRISLFVRKVASTTSSLTRLSFSLENRPNYNQKISRYK